MSRHIHAAENKVAITNGDRIDNGRTALGNRTPFVIVQFIVQCRWKERQRCLRRSLYLDLSTTLLYRLITQDAEANVQCSPE